MGFIRLLLTSDGHALLETPNIRFHFSFLSLNETVLLHSCFGALYDGCHEVFADQCT